MLNILSLLVAPKWCRICGHPVLSSYAMSPGLTRELSSHCTPMTLLHQVPGHQALIIGAAWCGQTMVRTGPYHES